MLPSVVKRCEVTSIGGRDVSEDWFSKKCCCQGSLETPKGDASEIERSPPFTKYRWITYEQYYQYRHVRSAPISDDQISYSVSCDAMPTLPLSRIKDASTLLQLRPSQHRNSRLQAEYFLPIESLDLFPASLVVHFIRYLHGGPR